MRKLVAFATFVLLLTQPIVAVASATTTTIPSANAPRKIIDAGTKAYVLGESAITVINASTNTVLTTITPNAVNSSTINEGVYISSDQSIWVTRYVNANPGGDVFRIDTTTDQITNYYTSGVSGASGITASGTKVYVAMNGSDKIAVFDIATKTKESDLAYTATSGQTNSPSVLCIAGNTLYIFQGSSADVTPWNISTGTQGSSIATSLGGGAGYCEVNPAGTAVYFGSTSKLSSITVSNNSISSIKTGLSSVSDISFNSTGTQLFIPASPNLQVLDTSNTNQLDSISSGTNPNGFALVNSGNSILISQVTTNTVLQISLNPTMTTTDASLTINTASSISAPTISGFWTTPTFSSSTLPAGLTLNTGTGAITGTPTVAQAATDVTITATGGIFTKTLDCNINPCTGCMCSDSRP